MNKENTQKLVEDFPLLYRGRRMSIKVNLMPFGFECGDGWFQPIYDLSKKLEARLVELQKLGVDEKDLGLATQVKEKFGGLRFYYGGRFYLDAPENYETKVKEHPGGTSMKINWADADYNKWVEEAEAACANTCEVCGKQPAKLRGGGWLRTLCDEHAEGKPDAE